MSTAINWELAIHNTITKLNSKIFPPIDPLHQDMLNNAKPIYIYTTYTTNFPGMMGNFGQFYLKGVETNGSDNPDQWEPYHLAKQIPSRLLAWDMSRAGTRTYITANGDTVEAGNGEMAYTVYDGLEFVADLLKRTDATSDNNLENWGVFASYNNPPEEKEVATAKEKLMRHLNRVVGEGDRLWRGTGKEKDLIGPKHRNAATYLKLFREWSTNVEFKKDCPFCGIAVKAGIVKCTNCHEIIDLQRYNELKGITGVTEVETPQTPLKVDAITPTRGNPNWKKGAKLG